jgi:adenylate cyclase
MGPAMSCRKCGFGLREGARFCDGCGAPVTSRPDQAEYKQVTVLFADVVGSMQLASILGPERLREVMTEVFNLSVVAVQHYGGTVDKFTGDGIMAVFGAPAAFEDHALRACLAALEIQRELGRVADEVERRDRSSLRLRVGLNSGQVIVGEMSSGAAGYTAIGEQVGLAQRMESAAPPGGVMLSESTARLVEDVAVLAEPELVQIKGAETPVSARRLLTAGDERVGHKRRDPTLVGRTWELHTLTGILDQSIGGNGCVARLVGPPGIGKSRMVREATELAIGRGVEVVSTYCESHTREVSFRVVARLLRAVFGISDIAPEEARARLRERIPDADPGDLLLLDDLLRVGDAGAAVPAITPDARRRRLAALLNSAVLARTRPGVYVIEDAHWIDEASEAMFAELVTVVPQSPSFLLITYRPEYQGVLSRMSGAQTIALAPLNPSQSRELIGDLLGNDPSLSELAARIAGQAAGNPFYAEELTRDLAERGVLDGDRGDYVCRDDGAAISVPDTLQATIAARIDRLGVTAKQALYAGAVIGARFGPDLLDTVLGPNVESLAAVAELLQAELVDQVRFTPHAEYAFRHPLIRKVAYEAQLKTGRAELHRRVAAVIEELQPVRADENAALIAEHLEAAGDLKSAFDWHMRAGTWFNLRDRNAARTTWQRAMQVADQLPADHPDRPAARIAPRTLLCATTWMVGNTLADNEFDELRELCQAADDKASLAIAMYGLVMLLAVNDRPGEAARIAPEFVALVESTGDPTLAVGFLHAAIYAKCEAGEAREAMRLAQRVVDLAAGDPTKGNLVFGSPLAMVTGQMAFAKLSLGMREWQADADAGIAMAAPIDPAAHVTTIMWKYILAIPIGALPVDATTLRDTDEMLRIAEQFGDDFMLGLARLTRGLALIRHGAADRDEGLALLSQAREMAEKQRFATVAMRIVVPELTREMARKGDVDGAIAAARSIVDHGYQAGDLMWLWWAVAALVELLIERGENDWEQAQAAIDRFAALPTDPGFVLHEITVLRLRGLLAQARGDTVAHADFNERLRAVAAGAGFDALVAQIG